MQIRSRLAISADGYVTTPDGWPAQTADPAFVPGESHGMEEFLQGMEAAVMGRTTFEPAVGISRWPWPNLDVSVLGSRRLDGTPGQAQPAMGRPPASITIETDDIRRTFEELKSRGVEFASDLLEFPWGSVAQFHDPDGNRLQIREGR